LDEKQKISECGPIKGRASDVRAFGGTKKRKGKMMGEPIPRAKPKTMWTRPCK